MAKMNQMEARKAVHALLFGPPKSGKTALTGTLAEGGFEIDWVDLESGSNTLFSRLSPEAQERVNLIRVADTPEYPIAAETILKLTKFAKTQANGQPFVYRICDTHGKIDCPLCKKVDGTFSEIDFNSYHSKKVLVIDSMTQLSNSIMATLRGNREPDFKPEWDDYRNQGGRLNLILSGIQNCPYNVVVISHEAMVKMEDEKEKLVPVAGTSNFSRNTAKYFDEVVYVEVKNKMHKAGSGTGYALNVLTGSRANRKLEDTDKPENLSLVPLFDGSVPLSTTAATAQAQAKLAAAAQTVAAANKPAATFTGFKPR